MFKYEEGVMFAYFQRSVSNSCICIHCFCCAYFLICRYFYAVTDGRCLLCKKEHYDCFMLERDNCEVCHAPAEDCPREETKPYYIVNKLCQLWGEYKNRGLGLNGEEKRPLKVLIFSQFRSICNAVADKVIRKFGHRCVAEYWNSTREADLMRFRTSKECFCMILPKEGAVGLNLTFCTHIFFLDEILGKIHPFSIKAFPATFLIYLS